MIIIPFLTACLAKTLPRTTDFAPTVTLLIALLLIPTMLAPSPLQAQQPTFAGDDAKQLVSQLSEDIITIFTSASAPQHRREQFRKVFFEAADIRRFGLFVLGRYARKLTPEQRRPYYRLLRAYLSEVYVARFDEYRFTGKENLTIRNARKKNDKGTEFLVNTSLNVGKGKEPIPIMWWVFSDGKRLRVFDLQVTGIWLAQEQRSQFSSIIAANGGNIEALLNHLRQKISEAASRR